MFKRKSAKKKTEKKVSFFLKVPFRNVTASQAKKIQSDARKKLKGVKVVKR